MGDFKDPEADQEASQFKVTDRRQFTSEGEVRQETETEPRPARSLLHRQNHPLDRPRRKRPRTQTNRTLPRA